MQKNKNRNNITWHNISPLTLCKYFGTVKEENKEYKKTPNMSKALKTSTQRKDSIYPLGVNAIKNSTSSGKTPKKEAEPKLRAKILSPSGNLSKDLNKSGKKRDQSEINDENNAKFNSKVSSTEFVPKVQRIVAEINAKTSSQSQRTSLSPTKQPSIDSKGINSNQQIINALSQFVQKMESEPEINFKPSRDSDDIDDEMHSASSACEFDSNPISSSSTSSTAISATSSSSSDSNMSLFPNILKTGLQSKNLIHGDIKLCRKKENIAIYFLSLKIVNPNNSELVDADIKFRKDSNDFFDFYQTLVKIVDENYLLPRNAIVLTPAQNQSLDILRMVISNRQCFVDLSDVDMKNLFFQIVLQDLHDVLMKGSLLLPHVFKFLCR